MATAKKTVKKAAKKPAAKKVGRPSKFTPAIAERICAAIADGKSSAVACKAVGISAVTMLRWVSEDADFRNKYARAREAQADKLAGEILEIADEVSVEVRHDGEDVTLDVSSTAVARNRLRVDARKWAASKLAPKKYGDTLAIGGSDDLPPVKQDINLTPAEAYRQILG